MASARGLATPQTVPLNRKQRYRSYPLLYLVQSGIIPYWYMSEQSSNPDHLHFFFPGRSKCQVGTVSFSDPE